jgi:UDP-N-acetylmuramoyl-tripeptide--D-alanyl-D-alanine ligase
MTAVLWTSEAAAAATGGIARTSWRASGVSIDSRTLVTGDLFVALAGPRFDGHDFVAAALDRGAVAAMVSRRPPGLPAEAPLLVVEDGERALVDLGRAARARSRARVVAVTGSVGKTGVKEALRLVLDAQGATAASADSLNNHWGVPLSLARLPVSAAYAVLEIGMNHAGEITPLSQLVRPHVAVVTTIEAVHRAHFDGIEAIADAKAEIFAGVEPGGVAVLNRDNPHYERLRAAAVRAGIGRVVGFGRHAEADVRLEAATLEPDGTHVHARCDGRDLHYHLAVQGSHWVVNSLCVLAAVAGAGADVTAAAVALAGFTAPKGRGRRYRVAVADGSFVVIDDSYNASPVSVAAAVEVLGRAERGRDGRRILVVGEMLELGDGAAALHAGLAATISAHGIDRVYTAGPLMAHLAEALPTALRAGHARDAAALAPLVCAAVRGGDVIAVKGSAASRMGTVVDALLALAEAEGGSRRRVAQGER